MTKKLIVTNNPKVYELFKGFNIIYDDGFTFIDVLTCVRDNIHAGRKLLTHPLSGSVKPYETPYKTVLLSDENGSLDMEGLSIIEKSIETANKFRSNKEELTLSEKVLSDFQVIDLSLVEELIHSRKV